MSSALDIAQFSIVRMLLNYPPKDKNVFYSSQASHRSNIHLNALVLGRTLMTLHLPVY